MISTSKFPKPEDILPHNKPMSLVDRIVEFDLTNGIVSETIFPPDAFFFQGHFEDNPITPGVILVEAMFQTCGLYLRLAMEYSKDFYQVLGRAVKIKNASFMREVLPNQSITIHAKFKHRMMTFYVFDCYIKLDSKIVCQSELVLS